VSARHGLARALSKRGICSRTRAEEWIRAGRVRVDGRRVSDPEHPVEVATAQIEVDGIVHAPTRRYIMLNKPRGVVTTAADERGRDTVYRCFDGAGLGWIAPVGRLDKASEGLLLFSNDPAWAAAITDPETGLAKTYHVQVDRLPEAALLDRLVAGIEVDGAVLRTVSARLLRSGGRTAWLEIVLDEGRNRQIRRLLAAVELEVVRLVRVAIGGLALGTLGKGQWRELDARDLARLRTDGAPG
jgi:23S rRNA pseudouridine2605 synthase